jgi:hypothetical protein
MVHCTCEINLMVKDLFLYLALYPIVIGTRATMFT